MPLHRTKMWFLIVLMTAILHFVESEYKSYEKSDQTGQINVRYFSPPCSLNQIIRYVKINGSPHARNRTYFAIRMMMNPEESVPTMILKMMFEMIVDTNSGTISVSTYDYSFSDQGVIVPSKSSHSQTQTFQTGMIGTNYDILLHLQPSYIKLELNGFIKILPYGRIQNSKHNDIDSIINTVWIDENFNIENIEMKYDATILAGLERTRTFCNISTYHKQLLVEGHSIGIFRDCTERIHTDQPWEIVVRGTFSFRGSQASTIMEGAHFILTDEEENWRKTKYAIQLIANFIFENGEPITIQTTKVSSGRRTKESRTLELYNSSDYNEYFRKHKKVPLTTGTDFIFAIRYSTEFDPNLAQITLITGSRLASWYVEVDPSLMKRDLNFQIKNYDLEVYEALVIYGK